VSQLELLLAEPQGSQPSWVQPPQSMPDGGRWRIVRSGSNAVGFVLLRSKRRTIGFVIGDDGLRVTAPNWVTLSQIDDAVIEKMPWILTKLQDWQRRKDSMAMSHTRWQSGGELPYLGCTIVLRVGVPGSHIPHGSPHFEGDHSAPEQGQSLWLPLPSDADNSRIREMAQAWLQGRARSWFDDRLNHFLGQAGLCITKWRLSSASTRWGSCNSDGSIMLNWRLIHFSPMVIDYVIAHELAHLREMNHSRDFWHEVEQLYPDYLSAKQILKRFSPDGVPEL